MAKRAFFGTDGIRGRAGTGLLTPEAFVKVGQAVGLAMGRDGGRVLIGRDTRQSGSALENALAAGLASAGLDVGLLGVIPTPGVAQQVIAQGAILGAVISASHNPHFDNGLKLFGGDGFKLPDAVELSLEQQISQVMDPAYDHDHQFGCITRDEDAKQAYGDHLLAQCRDNLTGLKIVIDGANGAGHWIAPRLLRQAGAQVIAIHDDPNGVNINAHCGALHPESLAEVVLSQGADFGIALDGDGDRAILVDERGQIVNGDMIMGILALEYQRAGRLRANTLVATSMSNLGLEFCLKAAGITLLRTDVGDRYVVEAMRAGGYILGGEQSGHIVDFNHSTTGDGLRSGLSVGESIKSSGKSLSELCAAIPTFPQILHNIPVKARTPLDALPGVQSAIDSAQAQLGEKGRIVVRYSGTELLARVMIEGPDQAEITRLAEEIGAHFTP